MIAYASGRAAGDYPELSYKVSVTKAGAVKLVSLTTTPASGWWRYGRLCQTPRRFTDAQFALAHLLARL